jgi:hypothetical protein
LSTSTETDAFVTNYVEMGKSRDRFCGSTRPMVRQYCHPLVFQSSSNVVYRNARNGTFTDVTARAAVAAQRGNGLGVAVADYDDDLRPEVFVASEGVPNFLFRNDGGGGFTDVVLPATAALLRNDGGNRSNALLVRLAGTMSNRDGVGARLRVTAGART